MIESSGPGWPQFLVPAAIALVLGLLLPLVVRPLLRRWGIVDVPGHRSSHTTPTIRGMGLATAIAALVAIALCSLSGLVEVDRSVLLVVTIGMVFCAALGWGEDYRGLPVRWRAGYQLLIGLSISVSLTVVLATPAWWIPVGTLAIAGYINVANFMDGLNGISGLHGFVVGVAYSYAGWATNISWLTVCGAALAGAFLAFLPWNLAGKRVFLGDTGSYFLGGAIACCAVGAFLSNIYVEYILSPVIIYLADSGFTLLKRIYQGEAWYQPHRQHVYQRLTDLGFSHLGSALTVTAATLAVTVVTVTALPFEVDGTLWMGLLVVCIVALYLALPTILAKVKGRTA
ncbi:MULTISPECIES: MraY family glycosyltransferase [Micrococcales]|uniref:MraY family glycosyltransferase n=1 Tax=Micrococcales TaxID=85006 RepID=UPI00068E9EF9|nr:MULTISPECIES: glycosyltransferase family 4 protein [Micrococcales]